MRYTKVVIIGGGFGGINVALNLKNSSHDVLIIDKTNHHLFQPLLYQVASAALSPGDIATPIREVIANQENTSVIMGEVVSINKEKKCLELANGEIIKYSYLVLAVGARHSYFGHDEWEENAPGIKTILDALRIRERILMSFEKAERADSIKEIERYLNFVIIGGGPTGVELAGAIAEIAHKTMLKNFRRIRTDKTKIFLVEANSRILAAFPEKLAMKAHRDLEKLGVKIITKQAVTDINDHGVQLDGNEFIEARNVIWAAGNQASPLLKTLNVPLDRQGRAVVEKDLSLAGFPEIFVIGDAAAAKDKSGHMYPALASVAIQQGRYVGKLIKKNIPKEQRKAFKYFDKGCMATIGRAKAIMKMGKISATGFVAWVAWCFVHLLFLIGYRNKVAVLVEWFFWFITGQRGARLLNRTLHEDQCKHCGQSNQKGSS